MKFIESQINFTLKLIGENSSEQYITDQTIIVLIKTLTGTCIG